MEDQTCQESVGISPEELNIGDRHPSTSKSIQCCIWVKGKGSFYIAQYPVRWTAQSALHFLPSLADLFIPTPTRLLREAF